MKIIWNSFKDARHYIVEKFTWLYIGSINLWAVFAIILYFSKYADLKLGKPNEKPEYNDVTWFVMLFACGIGVVRFSLFVFLKVQFSLTIFIQKFLYLIGIIFLWSCWTNISLHRTKQVSIYLPLFKNNYFV